MASLSMPKTSGGAVPVGVPARSDGLGMLLALDGRCVERLALPVAVQMCGEGTQRLDILVSKPPKAATTLLAGFLMELERHGIDYRLTSTESDLDGELLHYVHRFQYVSMILLDCLEHWEGEFSPVLDVLRGEGYRVVSLLDHRHRGYARTTVLSAGHKVVPA